MYYIFVLDKLIHKYVNFILYKPSYKLKNTVALLKLRMLLLAHGHVSRTSWLSC